MDYIQKMKELNAEERKLHDKDLEAFYDQKNKFSVEFMRHELEDVLAGNKSETKINYHMYSRSSERGYYDHIVVDLGDERFTILPPVIEEIDKQLLKDFVHKRIDAFCENEGRKDLSIQNYVSPECVSYDEYYLNISYDKVPVLRDEHGKPYSMNGNSRRYVDEDKVIRRPMYHGHPVFEDENECLYYEVEGFDCETKGSYMFKWFSETSGMNVADKDFDSFMDSQNHKVELDMAPCQISFLQDISKITHLLYDDERKAAERWIAAAENHGFVHKDYIEYYAPDYVTWEREVPVVRGTEFCLSGTENESPEEPEPVDTSDIIDVEEEL